MFYAVEGEPPFDRGTSIATLAAVVNDPPRTPRRAGPLAGLITALLAKDPADRPSGPALRAELARLATRPAPATEVLPTHGPGRTVPVPADPAPASPPPPRPAPERPLLPPAPVVDRRGRGRLAGVLALLVVLGLAGVVLAVNLRSGDENPTVAPTTRAAGAGGDGTAATNAPETTGATKTTRAPGTTSAPTTAAAGLPARWTEFTNPRGATRVGVPPGFKARTRSRFNATVVEEQSGAKRVFTVRSQNPSAPLPQASRDYRKAAPGNFEDFREVRYEENQTYAGHDGAVVFEYEAVVGGRRVHVSHINFKGRTWGYNVELIVPAGQWDASQELARQFEQAFRALG
jgi:hypothetical protein